MSVSKWPAFDLLLFQPNLLLRYLSQADALGAALRLFQIRRRPIVKLLGCGAGQAVHKLGTACEYLLTTFRC